MFRDVYRGKRVLVTGHTGFKGSWLALWLLELGAEVAGFSKCLPSDPCHFDATGLKKKLTDYRGDIRNLGALEKVFKKFRPQIVFHLAAQPIVRESYDFPKLTFDTNLGGTVNILECVKTFPKVEAAVIITSDKCYENVGWDQGYRETDRLGGEDPYSASKACAEIASRAYILSYFSQSEGPRVTTTRAGNVIGGGDWAQDRIIPDCVRAWSQGKIPIIRKPDATRPWQHVLEPLSGYLWLGSCLLKDPKLVGEPFNFGPKCNEVKSVRELVDLFLRYWGEGAWNHEPTEGGKKEAALLQLSCDKALKLISWRPVLSFNETVEMTAQWYKKYYKGRGDYYDFACRQIDQYIQKAVAVGQPWVSRAGDKK
ncbi:MAG: CDP-glucose 4,6-dehydratase [Candidatus Omnitrophica bacterium]|nr:CDP-glucose 4,6-dehydratase [Candidatus Omnitrophota bacterium]